MDKRQDKRAQFEQGGSNKRPFLVVAVLVLLGAGIGAWLLLSPAGGSFEQVTAENGQVTVAAADLADGQARFYRYAGRGGGVEFFLVKSADGVIRAAFDTCDVCYKARKGYRQEGNFMVCNNCNQQFRTDLVNEIKGGCNPAPLARRMENGQVVIATSDLASGRRYFAVAD
jgi:uncharacterized membrane protein